MVLSQSETVFMEKTLLGTDRVGLFQTWEGGRLHADLIVAFQYLKGAYQKDEDRLFSRACCNRTRGHGFKLKESRFRLDIKQKFLQ